MLKLQGSSLLLFLLLLSFSSNAKNWYVNDNSISGDLYCSAIGNDVAAGTASAPLASLSNYVL
jgi:hypothetical protein